METYDDVPAGGADPPAVDADAPGMDPLAAAAEPAASSAAARPASGRLPYGWLMLLGVIGLLLRLCLVLLAPRYAYTQDHDDFVRWGILAADRGVAALYTERAPLQAQVRHHHDGRTSLHERGARRVLNYPPLSAYLFWGVGHAHRALDRERYGNTHLSRALYAIPNCIADFLLALACVKLVQLLLAGRGQGGAATSGDAAVSAPARASGWAALFHPFVLCWLAPPIMIDSAWWGQNDSWLMAAAAWMMWAMLRGNWLVAGTLYGLALACKPLAVFLLPVWAYAVLFRPQRLRILGGLLSAVVVVNLLALPFWLSSGWQWFEHSYLSHFGRSGEATTLSAFNVWYIDALLRESRQATELLWGWPRSYWGLTLLAAAGGLIVLSHRVLLRSSTLELVAVAGSMLLAVAMFPTGMHERYVLLCFPFLIAIAAATRRGVWVALMIWMLAGTLQMTWCNWASTLAGKEVPALQAEYAAAREAAEHDPEVELAGWDERLSAVEARRERDRPLEWLTTVLALLATVLYYASLPWAARACLLPSAPLMPAAR